MIDLGLNDKKLNRLVSEDLELIKKQTFEKNRKSLLSLIPAEEAISF